MKNDIEKYEKEM